MSLKKIVIKTPEEIEGMRAACRDAALVLDFIEPYVKAGVTTEELDDLMLKYMTEELKDISACLGYSSGGETPYPKATCISVNHRRHRNQERIPWRHEQNVQSRTCIYRRIAPLRDHIQCDVEGHLHG